MLQGKSGATTSSFHMGPLYGPLHQFGGSNLVEITFSDLLWKSITNITFLLCPFMYKAFTVHKTCRVHVTKGNKILHVDFNVEPYKKSDGKIQNFVNENGLKLLYKLTN